MPVPNYPHRIFITFPMRTQPFQIPVPPEMIAGGTGSNIQTFQLIALGEILTIGGIQLDRFKWESFFPKVYDDSISVIPENEHIEPVFWQKYIEDTQRAQQKVRITINNTKIDFLAAIQSFKWSYLPGAEGDLWYQIELIEHKQGFIREFDGINLPLLIPREESPSGGLDENGRKRRHNSWYTTRRGDTLESISLYHYGTERHARLLYEINRERLNKKPPRPNPPGSARDSLFEQDPLWTFGDQLLSGTLMFIPSEAQLHIYEDLHPVTAPRPPVPPINDPWQ